MCLPSCVVALTRVGPNFEACEEKREISWGVSAVGDGGQSVRVHEWVCAEQAVPNPGRKIDERKQGISEIICSRGGWLPRAASVCRSRYLFAPSQLVVYILPQQDTCCRRNTNRAVCMLYKNTSRCGVAVCRETCGTAVAKQESTQKPQNNAAACVIASHHRTERTRAIRVPSAHVLRVDTCVGAL